MSAIDRIIRVAVLGAAIAAGSAFLVLAQEISESQLAAAQLVVRNGPQLGDFSSILPRLESATIDRLIRERPEFHAEIAAAVQATAVALAAPRRAELDADFARTWAKHFTEEELVAINAFFGSEIGAKYKQDAPVVGRELIQASNNWATRVGDEMLEKSIEELRRQGFDF